MKGQKCKDDTWCARSDKEIIVTYTLFSFILYVLRCLPFLFFLQGATRMNARESEVEDFFFINGEFDFGHVDFGVKSGCANRNVPEAAGDPG